MSRPTRGCNLMDPVEAAYLAGLLDSGGLVSLYRTSGNAYVSLIMSSPSEAAAAFCEAVTGIGGITTTKPTFGRVLHRWSVTAENAVAVLRQLIPFLVVKQKEALLVINFQERLNDQVELRKKAHCHPEKPVKAHGLCRSCYYLAEKTGTIINLSPRPPDDRRWQEQWITQLAELRNGPN